MKTTDIKNIITKYDVRISLKENNLLYSMGGGSENLKYDFKDLDELNKDKDYSIQIYSPTNLNYGKYLDKAIYEPEIGYFFEFINYEDVIEFIEEINKINDFEAFEKNNYTQIIIDKNNNILAAVEKLYYRKEDEKEYKDFLDYMFYLQEDIFFFEKIKNELYN